LHSDLITSHEHPPAFNTTTSPHQHPTTSSIDIYLAGRERRYGYIKIAFVSFEGRP
jgi:hypothetical protein